jgi:hypothetical protein
MVEGKLTLCCLVLSLSQLNLLFPFRFFHLEGAIGIVTLAHGFSSSFIRNTQLTLYGIEWAEPKKGQSCLETQLSGCSWNHLSATEPKKVGHDERGLPPRHQLGT